MHLRLTMTYQDWIQLLGPVAAGAALNPLGRLIADSADGKITSRKMLKAELQEPQVDTDYFGYLLKPDESETNIEDEPLKVFFQPESHENEIEGEEDNIFINKVPKVDKWLELAKKFGTTCELVK